MKKKVVIILLSIQSIILNTLTKTNLEDLSSLKNTKIVLLSEQTHFESAALDKKLN